MTKIKKYLLPILVMCLLLGFAINFRSFLMTNIVEPIAILFWAGWKIVSSVNQTIYWAILIVLCIILMIRLIPAEDRTSLNSAYNYTFTEPSRLEFWQSVLLEASMGKDETEYLRDKLKQLLLSMNAQDEQSNPMNPKKNASLRQISLPAPIHNFLFWSEGKRKIFGYYHLPLLYLTPRWLRRWVNKFVQPDTTLIDETLKWMESTMEVSRDK